MKKTLTALMLAAVVSAAPLSAFAAEENKCPADEMQKMPNPILEVIVMPFKVVHAFMFGPLCAIKNIPKNE